MNRKQKTCLLVSITAIVVMGLFPPWVLQSKEITRLGNRWEVKYITEPGPYSWIGSPPPLYDLEEARVRFIDLYRLGLQYFMVAVVTAGLIITLRDRKTG